jgi:type 1 glutamine amidotransferase
VRSSYSVIREAPGKLYADRMTGRILTMTGGHRVAMDEYLAALTAVCAGRGWVWAHATQPSAQDWLDPAYAGSWDALLLHDIPGLQLARGSEPRIIGPSPGVAERVIGLLETGQGLVVLHHAVAAWPGWEGWAEGLGTRFFYRPGTLRGEPCPSSGFRHATFTIQVADPDHPICEGIADFTVSDELYHAPVLPDRIHPILRHDGDREGSAFLDTFDVVTNGESTGVTCATRGQASDIIGWTTTMGRSPVVVLLMGDGPSTFADQMFRRLLSNALAWVASPQAHAEAAAAPFPLSLPQGTR